MKRVHTMCVPLAPDAATELAAIKQERSEHIAEWVRLTEVKLVGSSWADQLDSRGQRKSPQQTPGGINAATRELGIERKEAQRAVKIAHRVYVMAVRF